MPRPVVFNRTAHILTSLIVAYTSILPSNSSPYFASHGFRSRGIPSAGRSASSRSRQIQLPIRLRCALPCDPEQQQKRRQRRDGCEQEKGHPAEPVRED